GVVHVEGCRGRSVDLMRRPGEPGGNGGGGRVAGPVHGPVRGARACRSRRHPLVAVRALGRSRHPGNRDLRADRRSHLLGSPPPLRHAHQVPRRLAERRSVSGVAHIEVESGEPVATVWLNRPERLKATSEDMRADLPAAVEKGDSDGTTRAVVIAGRGPAFTAGIDVTFLAGLTPRGESQAATARIFHEAVLRLQGTFNRIAG